MNQTSNALTNRYMLATFIRSMIVFLPAIFLIRLAYDLEWIGFWILLAVLVSGINVMLNIVVSQTLTECHNAMLRLAAGKPVKPIGLASWPLNPLVKSINLFSDDAQQIQGMRTTLNTQIREAAAQEERNRLARDLHDSIKQQIFSVRTSARAAELLWNRDEVAAKQALADVQKSANDAMTEMNTMLQQLRPAPLEKVGFVEAVREQAEALELRSGATVQLTIEPLPDEEDLPAGAQTALFRIVQEAFSNIARHARAEHVELYIGVDEGEEPETSALFMTIRDDGQGFESDTQAMGMGLDNMRERVADLGGKMLVDSEVRRGTTISVIDVPVVDNSTVEAYREALRKIRETTQPAFRSALSANGFWLLLIAPIAGWILRSYVSSFWGEVWFAGLSIGFLAWYGRYFTSRNAAVVGSPASTDRWERLTYWRQQFVHQADWRTFWLFMLILLPRQVAWLGGLFSAEVTPYFIQAAYILFAATFILFMRNWLNSFVAKTYELQQSPYEIVQKETRSTHFYSQLILALVIIFQNMQEGVIGPVALISMLLPTGTLSWLSAIFVFFFACNLIGAVVGRARDYWVLYQRKQDNRILAEQAA